MSDFRCEWQALHGPRCSHQCNECKDNDTPPEPRMTSERQETEQAFERWYNHAFATRGVDTKHMNDCEDAFEAGRTLALRATPRAGSASKERGFFEWSCGCSLNNGLVTPCATHASPAAAPREHPSPEPYCASCDAREGEPCPHNVIQCARPRRAHPPRAGEVTEEQPFGDYDAGEAHKLALYFAQMEGARGSLGRGYLNLAALGRPS